MFYIKAVNNNLIRIGTKNIHVLTLLRDHSIYVCGWRTEGKKQIKKKMTNFAHASTVNNSKVKKQKWLLIRQIFKNVKIL